MKLHEVKQLVGKIDATLRSDDPRMHRRSVLITHQDGSTLFFRFAFMMRHGNWLLVFSEHQGSHVFSINDLAQFQQFETMLGEVEVIDNIGKPIIKLNCDYCQNEINAHDINSIFDKMGNRIDADICEGCAELHNRKKPKIDLLDCD